MEGVSVELKAEEIRAREWVEEGRCYGHRDPDPWFSDRSRDVEWAKRFCAACPVRAECLEYALVESLEFGIFGGLTAGERQQAFRLATQVRAAAVA